MYSNWSRRVLEKYINNFYNVTQEQQETVIDKITNGNVVYVKSYLYASKEFYILVIFTGRGGI